MPLASPLLRQPDAQHCGKQHSEAGVPYGIWPSYWSRAIWPDGHSCDPLESPLSRQPDDQHETGSGEGAGGEGGWAATSPSSASTMVARLNVLVVGGEDVFAKIFATPKMPGV